ncbi:MAG: 3-dehydroquinate synthase [Chitinophagaceae bacterium]
MNYITNIKKTSITNYVLDNSFSNLKKEIDAKFTILLIDEHVFHYHQSKFKPYKKIILIKSKESNKSLAYINQIIEQLVSYEVDRSYTLVGIGGGLVTDIVGFVASIYMRGLRCIYVPTTLLNMVDAAIGGKTAVNWKGIKNIVGTITQPYKVWFDNQLLTSLPSKEWQYGMAEVIKYAIIFDKNLFLCLEKYNIQDLKKESVLKNIIQQSVLLKKKVIEKDTEEKNLRKMLNFGHTIGHAIERIYKVPHGQSVAYGMIVACKISERYCQFVDTNRVVNLLEQYLLKTAFPWEVDKLYNTLLMDKKRTHQDIDFILTSHIGTCQIEPIAILKIKNLLIQIGR